ncbi:MAG: Holliday junction resolvase RuvX [Cytophagales bacterium]
MNKIIGIDYGKKYTGIAINITKINITIPLATIKTEKIIKFLKYYDEKNKIKLFIIGYSPNKKNIYITKKIKKFIYLLKKKFKKKKIIKQNEKNTSKISSKIILDGKLKKKNKKKNINSISAMIILNNFLKKNLLYYDISNNKIQK